MSTTVSLSQYAQTLLDHVGGEPTEVGLLHAYELGRTLVGEGAGLLDVVRLHTQAVTHLEGRHDVVVPRALTDAFLTEALGAFEMAYLGFQEANASLRELTASLEAQVDERTRQLQESLSALQATDAERRRLLARLVQAQEDERHRLADDLHDDTIQVMTAVGLRLSVLRARVDSEGQDVLDRLERTVMASIERLRKLVFELRPPALDREGLAAAVRVYAGEAFDETTDLVVHDRLDENPPLETRELLYRILQEALANASKHAEARRIDVHIEPHNRGIRASVVDDGHGFDMRLLDTTRPGHLGVSAMRERADMAGGWCTIDSSPGQGASMVCWVPRSGGALPEDDSPSRG